MTVQRNIEELRLCCRIRDALQQVLARPMEDPLPFSRWDDAHVQQLADVLVEKRLFDDAVCLLSLCKVRCTPTVKDFSTKLMVGIHCQYVAAISRSGLPNAHFQVIKYLSKIGAEPDTETFVRVVAKLCENVDNALEWTLVQRVLRFVTQTPYVSAPFQTNEWQDRRNGLDATLSLQSLENASTLYAAFPVSLFRWEPILLVENLLMCQRVKEVAHMLDRSSLAYPLDLLSTGRRQIWKRWKSLRDMLAHNCLYKKRCQYWQ